MSNTSYRKFCHSTKNIYEMLFKTFLFRILIFVYKLNTNIRGIDNRLLSLENKKVYKDLDLKDSSYYQKPFLVLKKCIENGTVCSVNRKNTLYEGIIYAGSVFHYYGYITTDNDYSSFIIHCYSADFHYHFIQRQKAYTYTTISHSSPITI